MGLTPVKETVGAVRDVFIKVFELFTGGFKVNKPLGFTSGVVLPKGSLLKVDESARTATPIKTALMIATAEDNTAIFVGDHPFRVGEHIAVEGQATAATITKIEVKDGRNRIRVGAAFIDNGATSIGTPKVVYKTIDAGQDGNLKPFDAPNGILRYDTTLATGEEAAVAVRASVYKGRLPDVFADVHLEDLKLIHFSESK